MKNKLIGHFSAFVSGAALTGIIATSLSETIGYHTLGAFLFGALGQTFVASYIEKRLK
jgi:hypothetical protein